MLYNSRVGSLDMKALSLKGGLSNEEIDKIIDMKPLMISSTDKNIINRNNYESYFSKLLTKRGIEIQNDVLTRETVRAKCLQFSSTIFGIIGSAILIYNYVI